MHRKHGPLVLLLLFILLFLVGGGVAQLVAMTGLAYDIQRQTDSQE